MDCVEYHQDDAGKECHFEDQLESENEYDCDPNNFPNAHRYFDTPFQPSDD